MGIYSTMHENAVAIDLNQVTPVFESANFVAMSLEAVAESEANYNKIMEAIGVSELSYYEEHGSEIVYEAEGFAGFIESAKKFFQNIWEKIKGIFHKFFAWLSSLTKDSKDFAKKYEAEARKKWPDLDSSFSIKGYKFTKLEQVNWDAAFDKGLGAVPGSNGRSVADLPDTESELNALITKLNGEWIGNARAAIANNIVGSSDSTLEDNDFDKRIKEGFRNGESSAQNIEKAELDLEKAIRDCKDYASTKKSAEKAYSTFEHGIRDLIKGMDNLKKALDKEKTKTGSDGKEIIGPLTSAASKLVTGYKDVTGMLNTANGIYLQALKDQATQSKKLIAAVITTGKVKKESADLFSTQESGSLDFLSNIVLR